MQDQLNKLLAILEFLSANPVILTPVIIATIPLVVFIYKNRQYKKGAYYQITKNPYSLIQRDKGKYGEYLIYKFLRHFENRH